MCFLIGISWADESEDIALCRLFLQESVKRDGVETYRSSPSSGVCCCCSISQIGILRFVAFSRQFLMFPALISTVAMSVFSLGADALSLTMNAVALLLILDLDNLI